MLCVVILLFISSLKESAGTKLLQYCNDPHFAGANIALGQHTEQSGTYTDNAPVSSNAVDGNTDTSAMYGTCAHTMPVKNNISWWQVFFERPYTITGIIIYSRSNAKNRKRLQKFAVTGLEEGNGMKRTLYNDSIKQQYPERIIVIPIDKYDKVKFNSVVVSVPPNYNDTLDNGNSMLTLCEVEIYTFVSTNSTNLTNPDIIQNSADIATFTTIYLVGVGIASGIFGIVIASIIWFVIWFVKYRDIPRQQDYLDLANVDRCVPSYDQITQEDPVVEIQTEEQYSMYEHMS